MASSNMLSYVKEHVLECIICTEPFKSPKTLPCLHVFCRDCIGTHITKTIKQGNYKCPVCKELHVLPDTGVDSLRDAFLQKSLLEVANLVQNKAIPCSSCDGGQDAKSACSTCGDFLCDECEAIHKRIRATRNHVLTPVDEMTDAKKLADFQKLRYNPCSVHGTELSKFYCNKDGKEICHMCIYHPNHKGHDVITMEAKLEELKMQTHGTKALVKTNLNTLNSEKQVVSEMITHVRKEEKQALQTLSNRIKSFNQMVEEYEKQMTEEIKCISANNQQAYQSQLQKIDASIQENKKWEQQIALLDSLPIPSAIEIAQHTGAHTITHASEKNCIPFPVIQFIGSTLRREDMHSSFRSLIGFVPQSIRKEMPFKVLSLTYMPEEMKAKAISIVHEAMWDYRSCERNYKTYDDISERCASRMTQVFPNSGRVWQCEVSTLAQSGSISGGCISGTIIELVINALYVYISLHKEIYNTDYEEQ